MPTHSSRHPFFAERFDAVSSAIAEAEVYVFDDGAVRGFIGLQENYVAGLFVRADSRGQSIGSALLSPAASLKQKLSVHVFSKNERAMRFYQKNGFVPVSSALNAETGETEVLLEL